jgi:hypothetical protein
MAMFLYKIGRFLQLAALLLLPAAVAGEVAGSLSLKDELTLLGVGIGFFAVGWLLQQAGKPPG